MRINYEQLDEEYESLPRTERIPRKPVGSLTDNLRQLEPARNGAYKRNKDLNPG